MPVPLVWVYFNAGGHSDIHPDHGVVYLSKRGTRLDLERQQIRLVEGMTLRMFDCDLHENGNHDDVIAEGVVHFDAQQGEWCAVFPTAGPTHVSEARNFPNQWAWGVDWPAVHQAVGYRMDGRPS